MKTRLRNIFNAMMNENQNTNPTEPNTEEHVVAEGSVVDAESANPEEVAQSEAQLDNWEAKYTDINDRYMRLYSEFDNFRKRTSRERIELTKTAASDIFAAILPVVDDFDRAAKAIEQAGTSNAESEGMLLIYSKLKGILTARGLEEMNAVGQDFDPEVHEAITQIPAPDESMKGKVIDQVEKGYALHGKVIRFAKVVVGS
jgi:molecular chaperone GrpE